ncbi:UDP-2,3-diacylglucosamine diphosphatase LpxI, partial [Parvibaculum sp.]
QTGRSACRGPIVRLDLRLMGKAANFRKLGIAAGSGPLPVAIAKAATDEGREVFIVGIEGAASADIEAFPHAWVRIGALGEFLRLLKREGCEDIVLIGGIKRPDLSKLGLDMTAMKILPRLAGWMKEGDDGLLRGLSQFLEKDHGFRLVGAHEIAASLLAPEGILTSVSPSPQDENDIDIAARAALAIGALDIGQGAIACRGIVLALEAVEGTDAMLARVAGLPNNIRGSETKRQGVLVKLSKPGQERRVDMPTIGVETVERAAVAGLAGIAVEAGGTLIADIESVARAANAKGLFVTGLSRKRFEQTNT